HFLPDLVAVLRPPLLHEFLEDGINFLWQNDFEPHQLIAGGSRLSARNPLPLQPQGLARTGAGRDAHADFTVDRRHRHLAAEHRFIKRDRQIDQYIPALARSEERRVGKECRSRGSRRRQKKKEQWEGVVLLSRV